MAVHLNMMKSKIKSHFPAHLQESKLNLHKVKMKMETGWGEPVIMTDLLFLSLNPSLVWEQKLIAFLVFRHSARDSVVQDDCPQLVCLVQADGGYGTVIELE